MLFNSFVFVVFVITTLFVYYTPFLRSLQVYVLIGASFVFYAYGQPYLLILLVVSASLNALASYYVFFARTYQTKLIYAISGVAVNLAILAGFKYSPLFGKVLQYYTSLDGIGAFLVAIPLPVGISFYTFQGISLVVDLYRSARGANTQPKMFIHSHFMTHYFQTLFFISFFPQLVAGPILKAHQFYRQIQPKYAKNVDWYGACKIIIIGYFLKMVIADNLKDQTFWIAYPYFEAFTRLHYADCFLGIVCRYLQISQDIVSLP